jgi:hypothetical protein
LFPFPTSSLSSAGVGPLLTLDPTYMILSYSASAPEMISINSLVIFAWRKRL